jgi:hypothetical protein
LVRNFNISFQSASVVGGRNTNATPAQSPARWLQILRTHTNNNCGMKILLFIFIYLFSLSPVFSQTNNVSVVKKGLKSYLVDSQNNQTSIPYDSILSDQTYFWGYNKNIITIYSRDTLKVILDNVRSIHKISPRHLNYQILQGNKIVWLNSQGNIFPFNPNENLRREVCGTVPHFLSQFYKRGDSSYLYLASTGSDGNNFKKNTLNITSLVGNNSLMHLNNTETFHFTTNDEFSKELDENIFFEITPSQKVTIIELNLKNEIFSKKVLVSSIDRYYEMTMRNDFKTFHPFIFQKQNLYGYYPLTKTAKYLFLNPLEESFARFELPNGKKGWLDIDGIEYLDK